MNSLSRQKSIYTTAVLATAAVTTVCFALSDTPDKVYLNPIYVDIVVFCAGVFLLVDAWKSLRHRFVPSCVRGMIGAAIITIHLMQLIYDLTR
jgi:hypothetical protein